MPGTTRQEDRLIAIRLRYCINTHLEDQGLATPAAIGAAVGMPPAEAVRLLTRRQWRERDAASLQRSPRGSSWTCRWKASSREHRPGPANARHTRRIYAADELLD